MPIITIHHATNFAETLDGLDDRIFETVGWFPTKSQALVVEPVFDRDVFGRFFGVPILQLEPFVLDEPEEDEEELEEYDEEEYVKEFWDAAANLKAFDIPYILSCVGRINTANGTLPCLWCMYEGFSQGGFTHFCDHCRENRQNDENHDYGSELHLITYGSWSWDLEEKTGQDPDVELEDEDDEYWSDEDDWSEGTGFTPEFM